MSTDELDEDNQLLALSESESRSDGKKKFTRRTKSDHKWTSEQIEKLISLVQGEKSIWEAHTKAYQSRHIRASAWKRVADQLSIYWTDSECTPEEVKSKWLKLRQTQRQIVRHVRSSSTSRANKTKAIVWEHWASMKFVLASDYRQPTFFPRISPVKRIKRKTTASPALSMQSACSEAEIIEHKPVLEDIQPVSDPLHGVAVVSTTDAKDDSAAFGEMVAAELRSLPSDKRIELKSRLSQVLWSFLQNK